MFKHILIPTDGSENSRNAVKAGIKFAKEAGAQVTGLYVCPAFHVLTYQVEMLEASKEKFSKESARRAIKYLAEIESEAKGAGVTCDAVSVVSDRPYEEIVRAALQKRCDLIIMASHGRRGMKGILLGSETQKVLAHSTIPVLVYR